MASHLTLPLFLYPNKLHFSSERDFWANFYFFVSRGNCFMIISIHRSGTIYANRPAKGKDIEKYEKNLNVPPNANWLP